MNWELVAIWAIVVFALVWFHLDERRIAFERLRRRAEVFAIDPAYRHRARRD
jgi:hypothetical protein